VRIFEPSLTVRLVYVSGSVFYADYIYFESVTAVESESWGAIKGLFR
jgi:hypothetical protein